MSKIRVLAHGLRRVETAGTVIDRPYGPGSYSLVRYHSPMEVFTAYGMVQAKPGDCILFVPGFRHYYWGSTGKDWVNDWMHLTGEDILRLTDKYQIPVNVLLTPSKTNFFPPIFEAIAHEEYHAGTNWEEAVELLMIQLLLKLGRELNESSLTLSPTEAEHLSSLRTLRQQLYTNLEQQWTVTSMAAEVGLSTSRFAALYQQFFDVSPIEDLLRARIQHAQYLLTNRAIHVSEVAKRCGFRNVNYFSTIFHRRIGCAPRDYYLYVNPTKIKKHETTR